MRKRLHNKAEKYKRQKEKTLSIKPPKLRRRKTNKKKKKEKSPQNPSLFYVWSITSVAVTTSIL